jgi:hypothetical protein
MTRSMVILLVVVASGMLGCGRQSHPSPPVADMVELSRTDFDGFLREWARAPIIYMAIREPDPTSDAPVEKTPPVIALFTSEELAQSYVGSSPDISAGGYLAMAAHLSSLHNVPYKRFTIVLNSGSASEKTLTAVEAQKLIAAAKKAHVANKASQVTSQ